MNQDNRNLFLAIGLSLLVIVGWNWFYGVPQMEKARQTQAQLANGTQVPAASSAKPADGSPATADQDAPSLQRGGAAEQAKTRAAALSDSPRVKIDTKSLVGSIALKGGRIDDVALKNYRETPDPASDHIVLLSPASAPEPYFAETGFVGAPGSAGNLPKADTLWTADSTELTSDKPVVLTWDNGQGLVFHRAISVDPQFMFTVKDSVENKGTAAVSLFPYAFVRRVGKPKVSGYAVLFEGMLGIVGDSRIQEMSYDAIEKETKATHILDGTGGWLGFTDKYWAAAVIPDQSSAFSGRFSSIGTTLKTYQTDVLSKEVRIVEPQASLDVTTRIFAGAKEVGTIDTYQTSLGIKNFDLMIDWGWFYFITKPLFRLIDIIYKVVGNFGFAILIVTVIIKGAFFPLANRSYLSMAKMKGVQPQMQALKERYPDDKQKQQQELMELYKREKINPIAGCLPIAIQIPVFFALYKVIFITIEMRQAPFIGWIKDLSSPDPTNVFNLFGLIPFDPTQLPLFGHFLAIGVWPMIMGVSMFVQMKMNPEPPDPIQKQMFSWMPVIFTFMLGTFPAGLVIYWTWNNTLSVLQQGLMMRRAGVKIELWDNLRKLFTKSDAVAKT